MLTERVAVLTAAAGSGWEVPALRLLGGDRRVVLLKRCVDLEDLLATAATGQARVAVVDERSVGLDADSVSLLRRSGLGVVVVHAAGGSDDGRVGRLGVGAVLEAGEVDRIVDVVLDAAASETAVHEDAPVPADHTAPDPVDPGRTLAVWGPTGAPGRTTVAVGLAAELAARDRDVFLVDADSYGGAVAQHLGILDEASGLLAAARLANAGHLDHTRLAGVARGVGPRLRVLTGLPRPDRWTQVRASAFDLVLEASRGMGRHVVLDLGFNLEDDAVTYEGSAPRRSQMTVAGLQHADEVVVVGAADPVGLARLARSLVELLELVPTSTLRVVVNRVRPSLGWAERDVRAMVEGFVTPASMHFLPDDRATADRALVGGRTLAELGDSALRRGVAELADLVAGLPAIPPRRGRLRRR